MQLQMNVAVHSCSQSAPYLTEGFNCSPALDKTLLKNKETVDFSGGFNLVFGTKLDSEAL